MKRKKEIPKKEKTQVKAKNLGRGSPVSSQKCLDDIESMGENRVGANKHLKENAGTAPLLRHAK